MLLNTSGEMHALVNYPLIDDCIKEYRLHKDGYWYDVRNEVQRWDTCFEEFHDCDSDEQE